MLFHFTLKPLADIAPWQPVPAPTPQTPGWLCQPHLSWFGLTDGWYWIAAGEAQLFRYTPAMLAYWRCQAPKRDAATDEASYVDYHIVRLWEDVIDLLPAAMDAIPQQLANTLEPDGKWSQWWDRAWAFVADDDIDLDLWYDATTWWSERALDTAYLRKGPHIWLWSDTNATHIQWDNRACVIDGIPIWTASHGIYSIPTASFLNEARDFDARFIAAMGKRVTQVTTGWERTGVALDPHLSEEHHKRAWWLQRCLDKRQTREPTDWDVVMRAIRQIEKLPAFATRADLRILGESCYS